MNKILWLKKKETAYFIKKYFLKDKHKQYRPLSHIFQ